MEINEKEVVAATPTNEADDLAAKKLARAKVLGVIDKDGNINESLFLKRDAWQKRFAPYADKLDANNPSALKSWHNLRKEMSEALAESLGELPTAKYLVQSIEGAVSNSIYDTLINQVYSAEEEIPVGQGAEYILANGMTTSTLDPTKFIPDARNDIDNYTHVDSIAIPAEIKQTELTIATWMYINYFLSGKVDELANIVRNEVNKSIDLKSHYDRIQLIKTIFTTIFAKASSTTAAPTNHLAGTKEYIVDAVKEWLDFIFPILSHNKVYAYDGTAFTGYNNAVESDLVHIVNYQTYNNIQKVAKTFLSSKEFETFAKINQFVVLPTSMFNPTAGAGNVEQLNVLTDTQGARVPGAILTIDRRALKRVRNLKTAYNEFYPKNLTEVVWGDYRYAQGFLKWGQCAVYNNAALEQDFFLPTKEQA